MKAREIRTFVCAVVGVFRTKLQETWRKSVQSAFGPPLFLLVGFLFSALFLEILLMLAQEVFPSALTNLDTTVFRWFQGIRFAAGDHVFLVLTRLGNARTLIAVVICVTLSLVVWRRHFEASLFGVGSSLSALSMVFEKWITHRPRPFPSAALVSPSSSAFPSGHVAVGTVVYVFLAHLITRELKSRHRRILILSTGVILALVLAWTRLYLGVHWMSDVLGGFALASFWLAILISLVNSYRGCRPLRASPLSLQQIVLQSVILMVLIILLFSFVLA